VYSCALFQSGKLRLAALEAIFAVSGVLLLLIFRFSCKYLFDDVSVFVPMEQQLQNQADLFIRHKLRVGQVAFQCRPSGTGPARPLTPG